MLKTINKMEKFKVKVDGKWVMCLKNEEVVVCELEENAMVCDGRAVNPAHLSSIIVSNNNVSMIEFIPVPAEKQPESKPKELDLCEIFKDAPRGLKLWSVIYGEVEFSHIVSGSTDYPILVNVSDGNVRSIASDGLFNKRLDGECTLFPSKEKRDWSTFKLPYKLPVKGELCWTMSSVGNWIPRFATGELNNEGKPTFFCNQEYGKLSLDYAYPWQPLSEVPEVLKNHLKFK